MARTPSMTDALRRDVLDGVFAPGERLIELQLTNRYGVGRAAVRSALVELSSEGLVEREANRGAMVRRMSLEEVIQITEARMVLESLLAAHAARNATDEERDELADIEAQMRKATAHNAPDKYSALNALFHQRVREISRHPVAAGLVANLRNRAAHHQYRLAQLPGRPAESVEQHARIIWAITAGDADARCRRDALAPAVGHRRAASLGRHRRPHLRGRREPQARGSGGRPSPARRRRCSTVARVITGSTPSSSRNRAVESISWSRRTTCVTDPSTSRRMRRVVGGGDLPHQLVPGVVAEPGRLGRSHRLDEQRCEPLDDDASQQLAGRRLAHFGPRHPHRHPERRHGRHEHLGRRSRGQSRGA